VRSARRCAAYRAASLNSSRRHFSRACPCSPLTTIDSSGREEAELVN
jgi:hypothetical protein